MNMKGVKSFFGHVGFYRRFIKDFSKISKPLSHLVEKMSLLSSLMGANLLLTS